MAFKTGTQVIVIADCRECGAHGIEIGATGTISAVHDGKQGDNSAYMWREDGSKYYHVDLDDGTGAYFWPEELQRKPKGKP